MKIKQIRDPALDLSALPDSFKSKIALIGCGPASISCATFLARMGYSDVTVYEKNEYVGGLSSTEIPQFRLPFDVVKFEVDLMTDLGVKVEYGKALGRDFTVEQLKNGGAAAVFLGIGMPSPKIAPVFGALKQEHGFYTSKSFLPLVSEASKPGMCGCKDELPQLYGRVVVFGAGDTAMDCATSALRCGAKRVYVAFRRGVCDMRAVPEETEAAKDERCEWLPWCSPKEVIRNAETGHIEAMEVYKTEMGDDGKLVLDEHSFIRLRCDFVISAFGSKVGDELREACAPLQFNANGNADVDLDLNRSKHADWLFVGGDTIGNGTTVEAVNDGKTAAWALHKYVQEEHGVPISPEPRLPAFYTDIDRVDLSVDICGIKFPGPFGLASATPCTSGDMIRRGFEAGWHFAVTKTFGLDKDLVTNISPRIVRGTTSNHSYGPGQSSFTNIELISEKTAAYWCRATSELKRDFPEKVVIASIMCALVEDDWVKLAAQAEKSGADALELNLSCLPEHEHEVLTNRGFMTLAQIEAHLAQQQQQHQMRVDGDDDDERVRYVNGAGDWGEVSGADFGELKIAALNDGRIVYETPDRLVVNAAGAADELIEFTHASNAAQWSPLGEAHKVGGEKQSSPNLSIITTANHRMLVDVRGANKKSQPTRELLQSLADGVERDERDGSEKIVAVPAVDGQEADQSFVTVPAGYLANMAADDSAAFGVCVPCIAPAGVTRDTDAQQPFMAVLPSQTDEARAAFLAVYGMWLGNGSLEVSASGQASVAFAQRNDADSAWLLAQFATMGFDAQGVATWGAKSVRVVDAAFNALFAREYGQSSAADAKWMASWAWTLSKSDMRLVLDGVRRADGGQSGNSICTASARLRDELVRFALESGFSAHFARKRDLWEVSYTEEAQYAEPVLLSRRVEDGQLVSGDIKKVTHYKGRTWCFTMPSDTILARRVKRDERGEAVLSSRPVWTKNCPHGMGERGMGMACGQNPEFVKQICQWVRKTIKIPFFAKMTPNVTNIVDIATAAKEGGANGVTAINTVSSLQGLSVRDGSAWPHVGAAQRTTYGGMSGNATRPMALRAVSAIAKALPGFPILATGGIDSAQVGLQFLYAGASGLQVCSAIQNQDFTVIQDYISGLQCLLFMQSRSDLALWEGQSPLEKPRRAGDIEFDAADNVPPSKFGPYMKKRLEMRAAKVKREWPNRNNVSVGRGKVPPTPKLATIDQQIGKGVSRIGTFYDLNPKEQVVALIDEEACISCGKCFMTCNDTGYQAITFDKDTHLAHVEDNCTGCTLCLSVCPIIDCITMVPKKIEHKISRGIPEGEPWEPAQ